MKYSYLLGLLFCIPFLTQSQTPVKAIAPEDAAFETVFKSTKTVPIVKGKLLNISAAEIAKMPISYTMVTPFSQTQITKTTKIAKDGTISLSIDYAFPYQQIFLRVGDDGLFYTALIVNKDLFIELDLKKIKAQKNVNFNGDGVKYLGSDGPITTYFNNHILYKRTEQLELSDKLQKIKPNRNLSEKDFIKQLDEVNESNVKIDQSYVAEFPSPYAWLIENERLSEYYSDLCDHYFNKNMNAELWQKISTHKVYMITNSSMSFFTSLLLYIQFMPSNKVTQISDVELLALTDLTPEELTAVDSVKYYSKIKPDLVELRRVRQKLTPLKEKLLAQKRTTKLIQFLDSAFLTPKADFWKLQIGSKDPEEQKILLAKVLATMKTEWSKKVLNTEYKKTIDKIASINKTLSQSVAISKGTGFGEPLLETPFGAKLYKVRNMKADDFIANLKQTYANKALVLDFWATWCSPCLSEMPYSKKLHDQTKELPVNFIYLCTANGSDEKKWKAKVVELKQPGIHIFLEEGLANELMNQFSFSGYPSYGFIDRNGVYKPGVIKWMSTTDLNTLTSLIKSE